MAAGTSRSRIQRALFEELLARPIDRITVSEVCKRANVSRTTYYRLYYSLNDVVEEAIDELFSAIEPLTPRESLRPGAVSQRLFELSILQILTLYQRNIDMLQPLLRGSASMHFQERLYRFTMERIVATLGEGEQSSAGRLANTYKAAGMTAVISLWVADGCAVAIDDVLEFIVRESQS